MPVFQCPYCEIGADFEVEYQRQRLGHPTADTVGVAHCRLCKNHVFATLRHGEITGTIPGLRENAPENIPEKVKRAFNEVLICRAAGTPNGALLTARRALQDSLDQLGAKKGDLPTQLNDLVEKQVLTPALRDWADEARIGGRLAAHGAGGDAWGKPEVDWGTEEDADQVIDFLKSFFEYVYVMPARLAERRAGSQDEEDTDDGQD